MKCHRGINQCNVTSVKIIEVRSNGRKVRSNRRRVRSNGMQVAIRLHLCPQCPSIQNLPGMSSPRAQGLVNFVWRGILDKIVTRSCAVRHYIVLHGYVAGDRISYPICCLIVMAMPVCRTTCCYIVPDAAIS